MYQKVQKYLQFLFNVACLNEAVFDDALDPINYTIVDQTNDFKDFDFKTVYDEITNFAFLSLLDNSTFDIDNASLSAMINQGKFERFVEKGTFEYNALAAKIKDKGTKTSEGICFYDDFNQKTFVNNSKQGFIVSTTCPNVISCDYNYAQQVPDRDVINIIRNNLAHNDYKAIAKKDLPSLYAKALNDIDETIYLFKDKNSNVDILLSESWLRQFKKVYFNSSYFQVKENESTFYFPRFLGNRSTSLKNEDDLSSMLNNIIHTDITVKNLNGSYMVARNFIESHLYSKVFSKDKQLRFAFSKKSKEELMDIVSRHQETIKELILNELAKKGYTDVSVKFRFARDDISFPSYVQQWIKRINYDNEFYSNSNLDEQLWKIASSCNLRMDGGFGNKEIKNGLTPAVVSLFASTIESTEIKIPISRKIAILQNYVSFPEQLDYNVLVMLEKILRRRTTLDAAMEGFHYLEKKIDFSSEKRITVKDHFRTYTAGMEFAFITSVASIYNSLVATQFTEKTCKKGKNSEYPLLSDEAFNAIKKLDLNGFVVNNLKTNDVYLPNTYAEKMACFNHLRNILLHGRYYINYSQIPDKIEDTEIVFETEKKDLIIRSNVQNVMNTFGNPVFYTKELIKDRDKK